MPMDFYNTQEVFEHVANISWVGGLTNMQAGVDQGATTIDSTDDVADVMIIISDGFDSFNSQAVITAANEVTDAGATIMTIGFGQNNFINFLQMMMMANMVPENFYTAGSGDALMGIVDDVIAQICSLNSSRSSSLVQTDYDTDALDGRWYLYKAIGIYLDLYGKPPVWADAILGDYGNLPAWAVSILENYE